MSRARGGSEPVFLPSMVLASPEERHEIPPAFAVRPEHFHVFLGTDLHVSTAPFDCVRVPRPFVAPCSIHRASDTARCASPVRSSPCPDVSSRRTEARSKGHRPDCCFSANRAAAHGVHRPFFALLPRLREPRPSLPATMACPPWPTFTCWCCTTTCWRPPVFSFWSVRQPA